MSYPAAPAPSPGSSADATSAGQLGAALSGPAPAEIPAALTEAMTRLASGGLVLRPRTVRPLAEAADVHARLEAGTLRGKAVLAV